MSEISYFILQSERSGISQQIEAKMDSVKGAEVGSVPVFNSAGELVSSAVNIGTNADDLPNRAQIEGIISAELLNIPSLPAVAFATTANDTRTGLAARDGYTPLLNDMCLVKNQANKDNGIYRATASAWVRQWFDGAAYQDVTGAQTNYDLLGIDKGVVNVISGTANKNLQFQFAVKDVTAALGAGDVTVTGVAKLIPRDVFNQAVSRNVGNDTLFNGTAYPFGTVARALVGASYPCLIKLAPSGGAYSESLTLTAANSNLEISSQESATDAGKTAWTQPITLATGNTRFSLKGLVLSTGALNPIVIATGNLLRHRFENLTLAGSFSKILDIQPSVTGWMNLRNIDAAGALAASIALPDNVARTFYIYDQTARLPFTLAAGATGANQVLVLDSAVATGAVRVPVNFAGTVLRRNSFVGKATGSIQSQAALDALLADTAGTDSVPRYYIVTDFVPTQGAQLVGAIIGKQSGSGFTENWIERAYSDAPATVSLADNSGTLMQSDGKWVRITVAGDPDVIAAMLTSNPNALTDDGLYIQLFGTPPMGIELGDLFTWTKATTTAGLHTAYANASDSYQVGAGASVSCWSKRAGTWVADNLSVAGVLTTTPTAALAAGIYTQESGTPAAGVALNDLFYWSGASGLAVPYLSFADASPAITSAGVTYIKQAGNTWGTGGGTASVYESGLLTTITDASTTSSTTWVDVPGGVFSIATTGVWNVEYSFAVKNASAHATAFRLLRVSDNSVVNNSVADDGYCPGSGPVFTTIQQSVTVTVATPNTAYKLQWCVSASASTIYNNYIAQTGIQSGGLPNFGESFVRWEKRSGFLPVVDGSGEPNWTDAGTIQAVGIGATTAVPIFPTTTTKNQVYIKQIGAKTYKISAYFGWSSSAGSSPGSGDYLFSLPSGMQFDTTLQGQIPFMSNVGVSTTAAAGIMYLLNDSSAFGDNGVYSSIAGAGIVVYDATRYRILFPVSGTAIRYWGSGYFGIPTIGAFRWSFTFQAP